VPSEGFAPDATFSDGQVHLSTPLTFAFFLGSEPDNHEIVLDSGAASKPKLQHVFTLASSLDLSVRVSVAQNSRNEQQVILKAELDSAELGPLTVKESDFHIALLAKCLLPKFAPLLNEVINSKVKRTINQHLEKGIAFEFGRGVMLKNQYLKTEAGFLTLYSDLSVDVNKL
jgi:hypothetical protein